MRSEATIPATDTIPLCVPEIRGNEWRYVKDCLDTGWVSTVGSYVDRFEREFAQFVGTRRAVATVNGTAALHIALQVAGVRPDDEVLVSTLSFIAPANAIRYAGAWPVFMDADPDYWQMDVQKVSDFLHQECAWDAGELRNRTTGRRIKAIVPVHILGHPVDLDPLTELARKFELTVIEDATESLGASYRGRSVGTLGLLSCFSFNGNKLITTGGGGMITTNDERLADRAKYLTTQAKDDPVEYIHHEIGYNYRLPNVLAAMGCAQLELVHSYVAAKRAIAERYTAGLGAVPGITVMREAPWAKSAYWMFTVLLDPANWGDSFRPTLRTLSEHRIQARPLWQPLHCSRAHGVAQSHRCEVARQLCQQALSLPCSVGLQVQDQERVIRTLASLGGR